MILCKNFLIVRFLPIILCALICLTNFSCRKETIDIEDPTSHDRKWMLPKDYVKKLGQGFDVTWAEFNTYIELYDTKIIKDFRSAGFENVRVRVQNAEPDSSYLAMLKNRLRDCIDNGLFPILAYQGRYLEETAKSDEEAKMHLVNWWAKMAEELKSFPDSLAFNVLIEISGTYQTNYSSINSFYVEVLEAIRKVSPNRIVIFPPVNLSSPEYLEYLNIPNPNDSYTMAEWHFYASGPSKKSTSPKYWVDGSTDVERRNILSKIELAKSWMTRTGYASWVGAWMAGNYNHGNDYSIPEQVAFASFVARELAKNEIPWSINADNKFYDFEKKKWFNEGSLAGIPIRDVILDPNKAALYKLRGYEGDLIRLAPGKYSGEDLSKLGFKDLQSLMVPFDYEINTWATTNFSGPNTSFSSTTPEIGDIKIGSLEVIFLDSY
jgi:hypothetical protein